jgi:hypothetical protein
VSSGPLYGASQTTVATTTRRADQSGVAQTTCAAAAHLPRLKPSEGTYNSVHSSRNSRAGLIARACRAGIHIASSPNSTIVTITPTNTNGSLGVASYTICLETGFPQRPLPIPPASRREAAIVAFPAPSTLIAHAVRQGQRGYRVTSDVLTPSRQPYRRCRPWQASLTTDP